VSVTMRHAPLPDQAILADFITGGHFGRHIRRMREVYAERHAALVSSAKEELSELLDVCPIEAGLQTIGWLPAGVDGRRVAALAAERAVEVRAIEPGKGGRGVRRALQLGFAAVDAAEIRRGVGVLREVVGGVMADGE
jgi:GntR family transcriptional regulator/MocR family aminotransferase